MENEFNYQADGGYFAQCGRELERLVAGELGELKAQPGEIVRGGVYFQATKENFYKVNFCTRLASRILAPLASFDCHDENDLYKNGRDLQWERLLDPAQTFAVFANVSDSRIAHSQYAALKLKDAIADRFRQKTGKRPSVERREPDLWINLNIKGLQAVISLDASGGPLHRRGYRRHSGEAPLQETLAAAIVHLSGWNGETRLYDPFCGSATILAEALLKKCHLPSQFLRRGFGLEHMPDFDSVLWARVKRSCMDSRQPLPENLIAGSDIDEAVLRSARENLARLPGGRGIALTPSDFRNLPNLEECLIVSNLPYGVRSGEREKLSGLYKDFGDFLKKKCRGATAFVLLDSTVPAGAIGLKPSRRIPLFNGPIECRLLKFTIY